MPDADGAVNLGEAELVDQTATVAPGRFVLVTEIKIDQAAIPAPRSGTFFAGLLIRCAGPAGALPDLMLLIDDEDLLSLPEQLRKVVRDARALAADHNEARAALERVAVQGSGDDEP